MPRAPAKLVSPCGCPPTFSLSSPPNASSSDNENLVTLPTSPHSSQALPVEITSCIVLMHHLHPNRFPTGQEATSCRLARAQSHRGWISSRGSALRIKSMGSRNPQPHILHYKASAPTPHPTLFVPGTSLRPTQPSCHTLSLFFWHRHPPPKHSRPIIQASRMCLCLTPPLHLHWWCSKAGRQKAAGAWSSLNQGFDIRFREKREQVRGCKDFHLKARPESGLDWLICAIFARPR